MHVVNPDSVIYDNNTKMFCSFTNTNQFDVWEVCIWIMEQMLVENDVIM